MFRTKGMCAMSLLILVASYALANSDEVQTRFQRNLTHHLSSHAVASQIQNHYFYKIPEPLNLEKGDFSDLDQDPKSFFERKKKELQIYYPSQLLSRGPIQIEKGYQSSGDPEITFVIIPGLFSEAIDQLPWRDKVSIDSSTLKEYREWVEFGNLGSIRLIYLKHPLLSMESIGSLQTTANVINERLNILAEKLPEDQLRNLVIVGYSRGAAVALELLSQAKEKNSPWLSQVRAVVSLGGVLFGSDVADTSKDPNTSNGKLKDAFTQLKSSLQLTSSDKSIKENLKVIRDNFSAWSKFASDASHSSQEPPEKTKTETDSAIPLALGTDLGASLTMTTKFWEKFFGEIDPNRHGSSGWAKVKNVTTQLYHQLVLNYNPNINKFNELITAILKSADELSTDARLDWWRTHDLPLDSIHYYSIVGSMLEPEVKDHQEENCCFLPGSLDYKIVRQGYLDFFELTGLRLNDSQMAVHKAIFWPKLIESLNPNNKNLPTDFLGMLETDHWGLALEFVNKNSSGAIQPFPRDALIRAVADTILEE